MPLELIDHKNKTTTLGMRVQTLDGQVGTVRWFGKLERADHPPDDERGHYCGIEFDEATRSKRRSDGTLHKKAHFQCAPGKGEYIRTKYLYKEASIEAVRYLREKFGSRVEDWHDFELIKFSIARRYDMDKVCAMLEKHLNWVAEFHPSADEYFPDGMEEDYPCGYSTKTDYDNNIIYCERPGNAGHCTPSGFVQKYEIPTIARWHAAIMETGKRLFRASNYEKKRVCYFVDLSNVGSMGRPLIQFGQTLATVEQDNYPEQLGRLFIVNSPGFFQIVWRLIKVFIDERTRKKVNFLPKDKMIEMMSEHMNEEDIPDFAGGSNSDWKRTNNGRVGSLDPAKKYTGKAYIPPGQSEEEYRKMEEAAGKESSPVNETDLADVASPSSGVVDPPASDSD